MSFQSRMYATANRLLTLYGQTISFVTTPMTFTPSTGAVSAGTPDNKSGVGYPSNYNSQDIDGTVVKQKDILLILSTEDVPLLNDVFTIGSEVYTALNIQNIGAQGSNIIYKIQLRQ